MSGVLMMSLFKLVLINTVLIGEPQQLIIDGGLQKGGLNRFFAQNSQLPSALWKVYAWFTCGCGLLLVDHGIVGQKSLLHVDVQAYALSEPLP
jgi:hypothetical protein